MRRLLATAAAGLLLVGSQAAATQPILTAADRASPVSETANQFEGIPTIYLIGATIVLIVVVVALVDNDDDPASP